jgi:hypothetical protein
MPSNYKRFARGKTTRQTAAVSGLCVGRTPPSAAVEMPSAFEGKGSFEQEPIKGKGSFELEPIKGKGSFELEQLQGQGQRTRASAPLTRLLIRILSRF